MLFNISCLGNTSSISPMPKLQTLFENTDKARHSNYSKV